MTDGPVRVTVALWVRDGQRAGFDAFEEKAFAVMARFGGEVAGVYCPASKTNAAPDEIHLIDFPSRADFHAYRDSDLAASMAPERQRVIARTEVQIAPR